MIDEKQPTAEERAAEEQRIDEVLEAEEPAKTAEAKPATEAVVDQALPAPKHSLEFELPPDNMPFIPPPEPAPVQDGAAPTDWRKSGAGTAKRWAKVHHEGTGAYLGQSGGGAVKVAMCPSCIHFVPQPGGGGLCSSAVPEEIRQKPDFKVCSNARRAGA